MRPKNEGQQEFFEEFKRPKSGIEKLREKYVSHKRLFITMAVENLVLVSILVIMLIVLFFSLGVERGKRISNIEIAKIEENFKRMSKKIKEPLAETSSPPEAVESKKDVVEEVQKPTLIKQGELAKYTIQIITYRDEIAANKKIVSLKKEGHVAFIIPKGGLHQVCVGRYKSFEDTKADLNKLRKQYKDCFVRSIE